ncbi:tetratricopeptide repeat protein [Actinospica sp.]|uniref:tetratricopeptide repeat protein n=1 Tax=Actinospica sp. TaxID=1872142 RepID=UPI002B63ED0E|nr:tetratricopeptide repeat protein [Actinospica sp.]HWG24118.1 tetratricopeptide repeat protein [Actinospica sp.]
MGSVWAPLPAGLNPAARRLVGELRALKDEHNLSLAQLSASTHYSRASWERWLNGKRLITPDALAAAATRFGADAALLATLLRMASLEDEAEQDEGDEPRDGAAGSEADEPTAVAQLPASTADFTGRCAQIQDLSAALLPGTGDPGQVSIAAITGGGGLGKTTLAVFVAHRIADRFPDGQLYVDLNGAFENALTPETVLGQWLHALGVTPAELPVGPEERAALYRSLLSRRRVLVVLDNARDVQQILPLLPATNACAVLITSRSRLAELPGAYKLGLTSLPDDEATILLAQLVGAARLAAEPEATAELLRACDGMPLALRIAGARLGARANWAVSTLARRLSDRRRRLDELAIGDLAARASFDVSYAALAKPGFTGALSLERAFRLLGLVSGPDSISLPAATALLGLCEARAELVLEALVDTHLLESPEPDRYRMHDLIRLYAAERAQADESEQGRADAVSRLIGWYLVSAANTHALLSPQSRPIPVDGITPEPPAPEFPSYQEALDWCERERTNLVAGVLLAAEVGLAEHAWKLAAAMLGFFNARRYLADWTSTHLAALDAAQSIEDLVGEAWMWNNLGFVYFYWEETEHKALESFERSLDLRVRLGDRVGEAIALNNISGAQYRLGDHAEAIDTLERSMRIREELGDMMGVGMACLNIGTVYSDNKQNAQAEQYLLRALKIVGDLGAQQLKLKTLNILGGVYTEIGETETAKKHLYGALELSRELREVDGEASALQKLAELFAAHGDRSTAVDLWQQALGLYERYGNPEAEVVRADLASAGR